VTAFHPAVKARGVPVTTAIAYVLARAANAVPEFRMRIRGDRVVRHEVVHPSWTIPADDDLFGFVTVRYGDDFAAFVAAAIKETARREADPTLEDEPGQDDLLFMTAIPWVSFTGFTHPTYSLRSDSVPMLAWGKFWRDGETLKMPLQVQVHHGLVDGLHVGRFYERVQAILDNPDFLLDLAGPGR
jgi:chloramphenicol O-acetyltransferase type A